MNASRRSRPSTEAPAPAADKAVGDRPAAPESPAESPAGEEPAGQEPPAGEPEAGKASSGEAVAGKAAGGEVETGAVETGKAVGGEAGAVETGKAVGGEAGAAETGKAPGGEEGTGAAATAEAVGGEAETGKAAGGKAGGQRPGGAAATGKAGGGKPAARKVGGQGSAAAKAAGRKPTAQRSKAATASRTSARPAARGRPAGKGGRPQARRGPAPTPGLVIGPVPLVAKVAGAVAVAVALCRLIAPAFPIAHVRGRGVGAAANGFDWLVVLPYVGVIGGAGLLLVLGKLPRLALAAIRVTGVLSAGLLAETIYLLDAGQRTTTDLPLGISTSLHYTTGAGLVLLAAGYGLAVAALVVVQVAWPRTVMEDDGGLDRLRPRLAAWGLLAGIAAAIVLGLSPFSSSAAHLAPPAVPERAGWDLAGGVLLALAAGACAVLPATFHPRLAAVGGYAAAAGVLATQGLGIALLVARSPVITSSGAGVGTLVMAVVFAGLALVAWRLARPAPAAAARR